MKKRRAKKGMNKRLWRKVKCKLFDKVAINFIHLKIALSNSLMWI